MLLTWVDPDIWAEPVTIITLACARGERESPTTHAQVRLNHKLAEAARVSCETGAPVRVEDMETG